ncbi:hypothetical protein DD829_05060 [Chryseobacterium sp. HMWF035]|nr:hypothetical protein DD829_05060 [Chryseobacterium sp. HMWF035]
MLNKVYFKNSLIFKTGIFSSAEFFQMSMLNCLLKLSFIISNKFKTLFFYFKYSSAILIL